MQITVPNHTLNRSNPWVSLILRQQVIITYFSVREWQSNRVQHRWVIKFLRGAHFQEHAHQWVHCLMFVLVDGLECIKFFADKRKPILLEFLLIVSFTQHFSFDLLEVLCLVQIVREKTGWPWPFIKAQDWGLSFWLGNLHSYDLCVQVATVIVFQV